MANVNKVMLIGHLTRDPQLSYTPSNTAVCEFGMAMNRKWRDQQGNAKEEVCFVDVTAYGKVAEVVNQYTAKGHLLHVEGRLKLDQWTDKEGKNRTKLRVIVDGVQLLPQSQGRAGGGGQARQPAPAGAPAAAPAGDPGGYDDVGPMDDPDIPF